MLGSILVSLHFVFYFRIDVVVSSTIAAFLDGLLRLKVIVFIHLYSPCFAVWSPI